MITKTTLLAAVLAITAISAPAVQASTAARSMDRAPSAATLTQFARNGADDGRGHEAGEHGRGENHGNGQGHGNGEGHGNGQGHGNGEGHGNGRHG